MGTTDSTDDTVPTIVDSRSLGVERDLGVVVWGVSEFSTGNRLLTVRTNGTLFQAHFDAAQWRQFQTFVAGEQA